MTPGSGGLRHPALTALAILTVLIAGAFIGPRILQSPLARAEERWYEAPRSEYRMTLEARCFCDVPSEFTVTVFGGQVTQVTADGRTIPLKQARQSGAAYTVDDLFMLVHELVARHGAGAVDVTFDPEWGYPVTIETGGDADTMDDELTLAVTSFEEGRYRKGQWVTY